MLQNKTSLIFYIFLLLCFMSVSILAKDNFSNKTKFDYSNLTEEEKKILDDGEIEGPLVFFGTVLSIYPGLGLGHAVTGRWLEKGWIFTVFEPVGFFVVVASMVFTIYGGSPEALGVFVISSIGLIGLKIYEVVDCFSGAGDHNSKYKKIKRRLGSDQSTLDFKIIPLLTLKGDYGLGFNINF